MTWCHYPWPRQAYLQVHIHKSLWPFQIVIFKEAKILPDTNRFRVEYSTSHNKSHRGHRAIKKWDRRQPNHILMIITLTRKWLQQTVWKSTCQLLAWPANTWSDYETALMFWVFIIEVWKRDTTHLIGDMTFHQFLRLWRDSTSSRGVESSWVLFLCVFGSVLLYNLLNTEQCQSHPAGTKKWDMLLLRTWLWT